MSLFRRHTAALMFAAATTAMFLCPDAGDGNGGGGGGTATATGIRDAHQRLFAATETAQAEIDTLAALDNPSDADQARLTSLESEQTRRFTKLKTMKRQVDARRSFAAHQLEAGAADAGRDVDGQDELDNARQFAGDGNGSAGNHRSSTITVDDSKEFRRQFSAGLRAWGSDGHVPRKFAAIITTTGNSILLPVQVLPVFAPTQDHIVAQAQALFGVKPISIGSNAQTNMPVPDITAGSAITQDATNGTDATQSFAGSVKLAPGPYGSNQYWESNAALAAPGYDMFDSLLPFVRFEAKLAEQSALLTAIKGNAALLTAATVAATTTTVTYANLMAWILNVPARWRALGQFNLLSSGAYAAAINMTSDAGNKLITYDNGVLRIQNVPTYDAGTDLDAFGATGRVLGVSSSVAAIRLRNEQLRLNRYTDRTRRDQVGIELVEDHAFGYINAGISLLKT